MERPDSDAFFRKADGYAGFALQNRASSRWNQKLTYTFARTRQVSRDLFIDPPYTPTFEGHTAPFQFTDFPFDFRLALTPAQAERIPQIQEILGDPPGWLEEWSQQVGAKLEDGLRESPSFIAFAREGGTVYHTYTVSAPDPFVAPYHSFLLARTPKSPPDEPRAWRKDEYAEAAR